MTKSILDFLPPTEKETFLSDSGKRKGIMLCYPFEEKRLASWEPPYFVDPKLDGERCRQMDNNLLVSSEVNPIISLPHIQNALRELRKRLLDHSPMLSLCLYDGELYRHGWKFEEIHSCVSRTVNPHPLAHEIKFHIFDIWNSHRAQYDRRADLMKIRKYFPSDLVLVPTKICYSLEEVLSAYDNYIGEGYEGIVIRNAGNIYVSNEERAYRSPYLMKFKPKKEDTYVIIKVNEAFDKYGNPKGLVGSFTCKDGEGNEFNVAPGVGWSEERKLKLYNNRTGIIGKSIKIEYQNLTLDRHVPRFGRFPLRGNKHLEIT